MIDGSSRVIGDRRVASNRAGAPPSCAGPCAEIWRPYIAAGEPTAKDGNVNALNDDQIDTVTRADGRQQVTYAGHPLYYFANDAAPGDPVHVDDIRGAGQVQFGGTWSAVSASGAPVATNGQPPRGYQGAYRGGVPVAR